MAIYGSFVAKVMLRDPTYEKDGLTYVMTDLMEWSEIPYVEPNECCCDEEHDSDTCEQKECHTTMCRDCRDSWEQDHLVEMPSFI